MKGKVNGNGCTSYSTLFTSLLILSAKHYNVTLSYINTRFVFINATLNLGVRTSVALALQPATYLVLRMPRCRSHRADLLIYHSGLHGPSSRWPWPEVDLQMSPAPHLRPTYHYCSPNKDPYIYNLSWPSSLIHFSFNA